MSLLLILLAGTLLFITLATLVVDFIISAPSASGPTSDHFDDKTFSNPNNSKGRRF